jgi:hypothetical protein
MRCFNDKYLQITGSYWSCPVHDQGRDLMADDAALATPDRIATAAEFTRELQALRARSGLTIRQVARAAKTPVATTGDCFSGRHLPLDRVQFARILAACGETDPARIEQWQAALARARRLPGLLRPGGRHRTARLPRRSPVDPAVAANRSFRRGEVVAVAGGTAAPPPLGRRS